MKGVIFTEFIEFVEERFSPEMASQIVTASGLPPGSRFSAVSNYDHHQLVRLVDQLGAAQGIPAGDLLQAFGTHLFHRFAAMYPVFLADAESAFGFLESIDTYIHGELKKLYPDAQFPAFDCRRQPGRLEMLYRSRYAFADLADGLIRGCVEHFAEPIDVQREDLPADEGQMVRFSLIAH